jgi:hypothetical protein
MIGFHFALDPMLAACRLLQSFPETTLLQIGLDHVLSSVWIRLDETSGGGLTVVYEDPAVRFRSAHPVHRNGCGEARD